MIRSSRPLEHRLRDERGCPRPHRQPCGVGPEPPAESLYTENLVGWDVAQVRLGADMLHEPGLLSLRRRLEDDARYGDLSNDRFHQLLPDLTGGRVEAHGAGFAAFRDHVRGSSRQVLSHSLRPFGGDNRGHRILRTHLGQYREVLSEVSDQLSLQLGSQPDRSLGHLDSVHSHLGDPPGELTGLALHDRDLEQRAPWRNAHVMRPTRRHLAGNVPADIRRAPSELHDVDVGPGEVQPGLQGLERETLVQHVGDPAVPRLGGTSRQCQEDRLGRYGFVSVGVVDHLRTITSRSPSWPLTGYDTGFYGESLVPGR